MLVTLSSGTHYTFPLFGPHLAEKLNYTLLETNVLATAWDYGVALSGPFFGAFVDKHGPKYACLIAASCLTVGYSLLVHTFEQSHTSIPPVALVSLYFFLLGVGNTAANISALSTTAYNFPPSHRGLVMGLVISCFGLSAFCVSLIDSALFAADATGGEADTAGLLTLMAMWCGGVMVLGAFGLRRVRNGWHLLKQHDHQEESIALDDTFVKDTGKHAPAFFKDWDAALLAIVMLLTTGTGLMYINNVGSMCRALFNHSKTGPAPVADIQRARNHHVALFSLASFFGRLAIGALSDYFVSQQPHKKESKHIGRLSLVILSTFTIGTGQWFAGQATLDTELQWATLLIAFGYGSIFTLCPTIVSEWWGEASFGWNWGWMTWAPGIGAHVFNSIFGFIFDAHVQQGPLRYAKPVVFNTTSTMKPVAIAPLVQISGSHYCDQGNLCYQTASLVACGATLVAIMCTVWLYMRVKSQRIASHLYD